MKPIPGLAGYFRELAAQSLLEALDDGQLLDRFVARRDEAAFAAIVGRHGPMVLGVCRRLLRDPHDADDAFQAAFIVLAKKAKGVRPRDRVGAWLHGVARRAALKVRTERLRRSAGQYRIVPDTDRPDDPGIEILDEELNRLPAIYRSALVLCELEGRTLNEVSALLNLPAGTLASRVARGRELLARRIRARGLAAITGTGLLSIPSAELLAATARNLLLPQANSTAFTIAQGVTTAMIMAKFQPVIAFVFGIAATVGIAAGVGWGQGEKPAEPAKPPAVPRVSPPSPIDDEILKQTSFNAEAMFKPLAGISVAADEDELVAMKKRCVIAAVRQMQLLFTRIELGQPVSDNVLIEAIANFTNARLELCAADKERLPVLGDQYRLYFDMMQTHKIQFLAGNIPEQEFQRIDYYRWNAKLQFRKLELKLGAAPR